MYKELRKGYAIKNVVDALNQGFTETQIANFINNKHGTKFTSEDIKAIYNIWEHLHFSRKDLNEMKKEINCSLNTYDFSGFSY